MIIIVMIMSSRAVRALQLVRHLIGETERKRDTFVRAKKKKKKKEA